MTWKPSEDHDREIRRWMTGKESEVTRTHYDAALCKSWVKECFDSADYAEGRRAFMEKRKPNFQGR